MSTREFFVQRLQAEMPGFAKVIRAMPGHRLDYKPHEKNTPAGALAWQIAIEIGNLGDLFRTGETHYEPGKTPETYEELTGGFDRAAQQTLDAAQTLTEEIWNGPAKFFYQGKLAWSTSTVAEMAWSILFDVIHHRGQLTVYLRPMGGKVPGVYGPSADD